MSITLGKKAELKLRKLFRDSVEIEREEFCWFTGFGGFFWFPDFTHMGQDLTARYSKY